MRFALEGPKLEAHNDKTAPQTSHAGSPAYSIATICASVELLLAAVCPFDTDASGAKVVGPTEAKNSPASDLEFMACPARSESVKSINRHSDMASAMRLLKFVPYVDLMQHNSLESCCRKLAPITRLPLLTKWLAGASRN